METKTDARALYAQVSIADDTPFLAAIPAPLYQGEKLDEVGIYLIGPELVGYSGNTFVRVEVWAGNTRPFDVAAARRTDLLLSVDVPFDAVQVLVDPTTGQVSNRLIIKERLFLDFVTTANRRHISIVFESVGSLSANGSAYLKTFRG